MAQPPTVPLDDAGFSTSMTTRPRGEALCSGEAPSRSGRVRDGAPEVVRDASLYHLESAPRFLDHPDPLPSATVSTAASSRNLLSPFPLSLSPEELAKGCRGAKASPVRVSISEAHDSPQESTTPPVTAGEVVHQEVGPHTTIIRPATDTPLEALQSTTAVTVLPTSTAQLKLPSNTTTSDQSSPDAVQLAAPPDPKMLFGHIHTFGAGAARRRVMASATALTPYEADLASKDRVKQKEAVKRFLLEHVRNDWQWEWPPKDPDAEGDEEATTERYPLNIDENTVWKPRDEWVSDMSEPEDDLPLRPAKSTDNTSSDPAHRHVKTTSRSFFKFESPDSVGDAIDKSASERKRRRQRRLAKEMEWNQGLQCFIKRRDAWTGARKVSRASKLGSTRRTSASLSGTDGSSTAVEDDDDGDWYDDVEVPIPRPLLPPTNVMRASITPAAYNTIYDKVIIQALTPSCPMNLKDVTRSCVQGWKRDGEWPPKATPAESVAVKKKGRKLSVAGFLGLDKDKEKEKEKDKEKETSVKAEPSAPHNVGSGSPPMAGSGIRRSLQRVLGLSKEHTGTANGNEHGHSHNPSTGDVISSASKVPDAESAVVV